VKLMNLILFIGVLGLPLAITQSELARAGSYGGATDCVPVAELVAFVAEETGYRPLRDCPRVRVTNGPELGATLAFKTSAHVADPLAAYVAARA
jgi:hypothetical protein